MSCHYAVHSFHAITVPHPNTNLAALIATILNRGNKSTINHHYGKTKSFKSRLPAIVHIAKSKQIYSTLLFVLIGHQSPELQPQVCHLDEEECKDW